LSGVGNSEKPHGTGTSPLGHLSLGPSYQIKQSNFSKNPRVPNWSWRVDRSILDFSSRLPRHEYLDKYSINPTEIAYGSSWKRKLLYEKRSGRKTTQMEISFGEPPGSDRGMETTSPSPTPTVRGYTS